MGLLLSQRYLLKLMANKLDFLKYKCVTKTQTIDIQLDIK